ncbi:mitogen-activated protein kinase kinase kinase mom-4 [Anaeramoeba ignava]|uniref:Mitogen-activated protein kinase kinase kinase mom-4 n=1 Tax=Anaeramoeba ignava TaxID=1746090 RepID=A0A9Q0R4S9_ANAIG|nr:mitogen-activated protein kinase kinase kinase mom-4 [Anaeramoeba ignava]
MVDAEQLAFNQQIEKVVKIKGKKTQTNKSNLNETQEKIFTGKRFFGSFYGFFIHFSENDKMQFATVRKLLSARKSSRFDRKIPTVSQATELFHSEIGTLVLSIKTQNIMLTTKPSKYKIVDIFSKPQEPYIKLFHGSLHSFLGNGSDLYSFGILTWELVTFQLPFSNVNDPNGSKYTIDQMSKIYQNYIYKYPYIFGSVITSIISQSVNAGAVSGMSVILQILAYGESQLMSSQNTNQNQNENENEKFENLKLPEIIQKNDSPLIFITKELIHKLERLKNIPDCLKQVEFVLKEFFFKSFFCFSTKIEREEDHIFLSVQTILETLGWSPLLSRFDESINEIEVENLIEVFQSLIEGD